MIIIKHVLPSCAGKKSSRKHLYFITYTLTGIDNRFQI